MRLAGRATHKEEIDSMLDNNQLRELLRQSLEHVSGGRKLHTRGGPKLHTSPARVGTTQGGFPG
jgi:hypothetical protein